jgi:16S rRNA C1402 (ribose-2'-O) methylase RsmI
MMASGMNGQSFTFHGYLPIERGEKSKKNLEKISLEKSVSNFIETPYRNNKMWKISYRLYILKPICVLLLILLYQPNISKRREHLPGKRKHRSAQ